MTVPAQRSLVLTSCFFIYTRTYFRSVFHCCENSCGVVQCVHEQALVHLIQSRPLNFIHIGIDGRGLSGGAPMRVPPILRSPIYLQSSGALYICNRALYIRHKALDRHTRVLDEDTRVRACRPPLSPAPILIV